MWHPAHVDGRTLVVIKPRNSRRGGYDVIESGRMRHDGDVLHLDRDDGSRPMTDDERGSLQPVTPTSHITACRGFDFFLLRLSEEK